MNEPTIGSALVQRRQELGLAKGQAADNIGMSRTTYSSYEQDAQRPSVDVFPGLATFLGVSMEEFLVLYGATCVAAVREPLERLIAERDSVSAPPSEDTAGTVISEVGPPPLPDSKIDESGGNDSAVEPQPMAKHSGVSVFYVQDDTVPDVEAAVDDDIESEVERVGARLDVLAGSVLPDNGALNSDFSTPSAISLEGGYAFESLAAPPPTVVEFRSPDLTSIERESGGSKSAKSKKKKKKKSGKK